jgi:GMP synthase (glutamine-hydrolysing)
VRNGAATSPLRHLAGVPVLHWHGDTFNLPEGTELLASSDRYAHQAFPRAARNVLGLQFHAEMGLDERFHVWTEQWPDDIAAGGMTVERLRADHEQHGPAVVCGGAGDDCGVARGLRTD